MTTVLSIAILNGEFSEIVTEDDMFILLLTQDELSEFMDFIGFFEDCKKNQEFDEDYINEMHQFTEWVEKGAENTLYNKIYLQEPVQQYIMCTVNFGDEDFIYTEKRIPR